MTGDESGKHYERVGKTRFFFYKIRKIYKNWGKFYKKSVCVVEFFKNMCYTVLGYAYSVKWVNAVLPFHLCKARNQKR